MASFGNALAGALKGLNAQRETEEATKSKATQQLLAMLTSNPALAQADPSLTQDLDPRLARAIMGMSGVEEQKRSRLVLEEEAKAERGSVRSKGLELEELLATFTDPDERELLAEERAGQGSAGIARQIGEFRGYQEGREDKAAQQKVLDKETRDLAKTLDSERRGVGRAIEGEGRRAVIAKDVAGHTEEAKMWALEAKEGRDVVKEQRKRRTAVLSKVNVGRGALGLTPLDQDAFSTPELESEFGRLDALMDPTDQDIDNTAINITGEGFFESQMRERVRTKIMAETGKSGGALDDHMSMMFPGIKELKNALIQDLGAEGLLQLEVESRKRAAVAMKTGVDVSDPNPQTLAEATDALRYPKVPAAFRGTATQLKKDNKPNLEKKLWQFVLEDEYDYLAALSRYNTMQDAAKAAAAEQQGQ